MILYWIKDAFEGKKSAIEVARNYGKGAQKIGGSVLIQSSGSNYIKFKKDNKEIWAHLWMAGDGNGIELYIVEKAGMEDQAVADAKVLLSDIQTKGKVSLFVGFTLTLIKHILSQSLSSQKRK